MVKNFGWILALFSLILVVLILAFFPVDKHGTIIVTYDCRIAEISPDIPVKVKEECRKKTHNDNR